MDTVVVSGRHVLLPTNSTVPPRRMDLKHIGATISNAWTSLNLTAALPRSTQYGEEHILIMHKHHALGIGNVSIKRQLTTRDFGQGTIFCFPNPPLGWNIQAGSYNLMLSITMIDHMRCRNTGTASWNVVIPVNIESKHVRTADFWVNHLFDCLWQRKILKVREKFVFMRAGS